MPFFDNFICQTSLFKSLHVEAKCENGSWWVTRFTPSDAHEVSLRSAQKHCDSHIRRPHSAQKRSVKNYPKFADKQHIDFPDRGGGQKYQKIGRHTLKPPCLGPWVEALCAPALEPTKFQHLGHFSDDYVEPPWHTLDCLEMKLGMKS